MEARRLVPVACIPLRVFKNDWSIGQGWLPVAERAPANALAESSCQLLKALWQHESCVGQGLRESPWWGEGSTRDR